MNQAPRQPGNILSAYGGYKTRRRLEFQQTATELAPWSPPAAGAAGNGYMEAERVRPARAPGIESDFITPFLQALGVGFFAVLVAAYLVKMNDVVWHLSCFVGFVAAGLWYIGAILFGRKTLWISETIYTGAPEMDPAPVIDTRPPIQLEVVQKDERGRLASVQRFADLPADIQDRLPSFAAGVLAGKGLTVSTWTGKGAPFSRQEFDAIMATLEQAGIVCWNNPNDKKQGRALTRRGRAALEQIAAIGSEYG